MMFTLFDTENILHPESFLHLALAVARTNEAIWRGRPWAIVGPDGKPAYTSRYPKGT